MPSHFSIVAERCTGNHFLRFAILRNFHITYSPEYSSHFFSDNLITNSESKLDNTLFICIVRHPLDWIDSFFKRLHHIPQKNKISVQAFITNEFYSIFEEGPEINKEIMEDRHMFSKERYKNIFEMRYVKYMWMLHKLPRMVKNHIIIPYEYLRDNYIETLEFIEKKFKLKRINTEFVHVNQYKGTYNYDFVKKTIVIKPQIQEQLLESKLGYNIPNSKLFYNKQNKRFLPYKYEYFQDISSNHYSSILECMNTNSLQSSEICSIEKKIDNNYEMLENDPNIIEISIPNVIMDNITTDENIYRNIKIGNSDKDVDILIENNHYLLQEQKTLSEEYSNFITNENPKNYSPSFERLLENYKLQ
jgi:hypothetical protein